ncbi:putative signal transducing protein [Saccharospirillum salsuginis]|uniref:Lipoprotein n=1 Tax=Saccharospirillum salsuginis TaxID=418750 RepID=A0A918KBX4_9GAMM|nr:DUF2007 domain-containing protein [Saccharospirillum salsuginis]GGX56936.1 lipoprotein [Saccharospirillum salsuginis]
MKLVYTHPNLYAVANAQTLVESVGIGCELHNEYAGGGMGELAPIDTWPELWVVDDRDYDRAVQLIDEAQARGAGEDWFCGRCGERNGASFEVCWACGRERRTS